MTLLWPVSPWASACEANELSSVVLGGAVPRSVPDKIVMTGLLGDLARCVRVPLGFRTVRFHSLADCLRRHLDGLRPATLHPLRLDPGSCEKEVLFDWPVSLQLRRGCHGPPSRGRVTSVPNLPSQWFGSIAHTTARLTMPAVTRTCSTTCSDRVARSRRRMVESRRGRRRWEVDPSREVWSETSGQGDSADLSNVCWRQAARSLRSSADSANPLRRRLIEALE
jgi:hypothetical protein